MNTPNSRKRFFLPHWKRRLTTATFGSVPSNRLNEARSFTALSDQLNVRKDEYSILREAVDESMKILEANAGLIMLPAPVDLAYSRHRTFSPPLSAFEQTLRERKENLFVFFSLEPDKRVHKTGGINAIPLLWQGQIIGVLAFDCGGKNIAPYEEAGLLSFCNQLAAIFGLRRYSSLSGFKEMTLVRPDDVERAVALQQSLQPVVPSNSCGLSIATHIQAAEYVAGDYFDLILVDQNKIGIIIADVEGKGISAALFTNLLRTTVHFLTRESSSTACVVGKINNILHKETSSSPKLFTLFYAVFDAERKILTYTGSGHVQPIVVRAATDAIERLSSDGLPVGIERCQNLSESSIQLFSGDVVVYFTDGLVDMVNGEGRPFGDERLVEIVRTHRAESAERIQQIILNALGDFARAPLLDDLTIIVTKVADQ